MADIRELYARRVEAASLALGRGDRSEAERLFSEALAMGEENFGANDPALAVPLNELSRLHVRLNAHARAEPLLTRLLAIRRASGENHPDVATVLAALAAVRRGLRDDAGAEGLYRQALKIREAVHAPEHMAVVVTLEQLADTCAALRKFGEASALLERALPVREKALGADHPTVKALRERLATLATKAAQPSPEPARPALVPPAPSVVPVVPVVPAATAAPVLPIVPVAPAPEEARPSNQLVFIYEPEKPVRRASVRRDRTVTPPFSAAVAAASLITAPALAAAPPHVAAPTQMSAPSLPIADPFEFESAIMPPRADEPRLAPERAPRSSQRVASPVRADIFLEPPKSKSTHYALGAGGLAVVAGALFFASSHFSKGTTSSPSPAAPASEPVAAVSPPPAASPAAMVAAPAVLAVARKDSSHASAPTPKSQQPEAPAEKRIVAPSMPVVLPTIGNLAIPETKAANVDSVVRAATTRRDTGTDQIGTAGRLQSPALGEDRSESPPVLIGSVPQPRYPDALRAQRIEGAVVVQFLVGADGTVDPSSMKVVRTPHELFTAAVRSVLPRFHFQPARSADAKPRAEWVQYSIQFSAAK